MWLIYDLRSSRAKHSGRLFWAQLLALAATDFVESVFGVLSGYFPNASPSSCNVYMFSRYGLEFSSCLLEMQIAMGLMAACWRLECVMKCMRPAILVSWPAGFGFVFLARYTMGTKFIVDDDYDECSDSCAAPWAIIVISCCGVACLCYAAGVAAVVGERSPGIVKERVLLRGLNYVLNFVCTFGIKAVSNLLNYQGRPLQDGINMWLYDLGWCLVCLNGVFNALTYSLQNRRYAMSVAFRLNLESSLVQSISPSTPRTPSELANRHFDLDNECSDDSPLQPTVSGQSLQALVAQEPAPTAPAEQMV